MQRCRLVTAATTAITFPFILPPPAGAVAAAVDPPQVRQHRPAVAVHRCQDRSTPSTRPRLSLPQPQVLDLGPLGHPLQQPCCDPGAGGEDELATLAALASTATAAAGGAGGWSWRCEAVDEAP